MASQYFTQEGYEKLVSELEDLEKNKMPEVIERIATAKELGDLSENAEYQDAREQQSFIAGRIEEIKALMKKAEIIKNDGSSDEVNVGSTIRINCEGKEFKYTITGSNEADPAQGLISNESPLGRAFIGRKVGDDVVVLVPKGEMKCKVLHIE